MGDSGDVGWLDLLDDSPADGALVVPLGHPAQGSAAVGWQYVKDVPDMQDM